MTENDLDRFLKLDKLVCYSEIIVIHYFCNRREEMVTLNGMRIWPPKGGLKKLDNQFIVNRSSKVSSFALAIIP